MGKGRAPCCEKIGLNKGSWTPEEDLRLISYIHKYGHGNWRALPKLAGLLRCGKSCRLRWINYLRPDIKRGNFTKEEEDTIIKLHALLGNKWSKIASCLPGRTDNEIKNVWNTYLKKRIQPDHQEELPTIDGDSSPSCTSFSGADQVDQNKNNTEEEEQANPINISPVEALLMEIPMEQSMDMWNSMIEDDHLHHEDQISMLAIPFSSSSSSSSLSSEIFIEMDKLTDLSDLMMNGIQLEDQIIWMNINTPDNQLIEEQGQEDLSLFKLDSSTTRSVYADHDHLHTVIASSCNMDEQEIMKERRGGDDDEYYCNNSKEWMEYLEKELMGLGDHELPLHHESLTSWVGMDDIIDPVSTFFQKETS